MERPVQQNFAPIWRLVGMGAFAFGLAAVVAAIVLYSHGQRDPVRLLIDALELFLVLTPFLLLIALSRVQPTVKWFISETGLKRVIRGDVLMIPWAWIYHMANTKSGFFVRWRCPREAGLGADDLEHRALFYPTQADAEELIALWNRNRSSELQAAGKIHFEARRRQTSKKTSALGGFMMFVGAALIGWGGLMIARQYPSASWPSVEGKVLFQLYRTLSGKYRNGEVTLSYEYTVAGRTNRSMRYSLGNATYRDHGDERTAEGFARSHQRGAAVTVFYDPKHPEESVLQPGPSWRDDCGWMMLGGFFVFVGFFHRVVSGMGKRTQETRVQRRPEPIP
jgi:hypothetical protein